MHDVLLSTGVLLAVISPLTYVVSIIRGTSRPHRTTRFVLMAVLSLNLVSVLAAHGNIGAKLFASILCLQAIVIFGLSIWRGMGGTSRLDWLCLCLAAVGLAAWHATNDPVLGVWFSLFGDLVAYIPAFVKTWLHPSTESPWFYLTSSLSALLTLLAYPLGGVSAFQIYIVLCGLVMTFFIYHRQVLDRTRKVLVGVS
jgi:hypothetical protein